MLKLATERKANVQLGCSCGLAAPQALCMWVTRLSASLTARGFPDVWEVLPEQAPVGVPVEAVLREHLLPGELFVPIEPGIILGHSLVPDTLLSIRRVLFTVAWKPHKDSSWSSLHTRILREVQSLYYFTCFNKIPLVPGSIWHFYMKSLESLNHTSHAVGITGS